MTHRNTWKQMERDIAKLFKETTGKGERNPLSGGNSKHTTGDIIHDEFYVECKYNAKSAIITLMEEVKNEAEKEDKKPIIVLRRRGSKKNDVAVLPLDDLLELIFVNR